MIKSTELRIGNLLYNDNVVVTIDARSIFDIWDDKGLKNYKPIPLTEEWLLRFGVKTKADTCGELYVKDGWLCEDYSEGDGGTHYIAKVEYVHTLQNAIHAIRGEELTIKQ